MIADRAGVQGSAADTRLAYTEAAKRAYLGNMPIMLGGDLMWLLMARTFNQQDLSQVMNNHRAGDLCA